MERCGGRGRAGGGRDAAVGDGDGTTFEMAFALQFGRPVPALAEAPDLPRMIRFGSAQDALTALCGRPIDLPDTLA